jgi:hypothetical protein
MSIAVGLHQGLNPTQLRSSTPRVYQHATLFYNCSLLNAFLAPSEKGTRNTTPEPAQPYTLPSPPILGKHA